MQRLGSVKAVVLDLEETLVLSETGSRGVAFRRWIDDQVDTGVVVPPSLARAQISLLEGVRAKDVVQKVHGDKDATTHLARIEQLVSAARTMQLPGAAKLLGTLEDNDIPWGIVTTLPTARAKQRLIECRLPLPRVLIGTDQTPLTKQGPLTFKYAAQQLGVTATQCLALDDTPLPLAAAMAAGMSAIGVQSDSVGYTRDQWRRAGITVNVMSLEDIELVAHNGEVAISARTIDGPQFEPLIS